MGSYGQHYPNQRLDRMEHKLDLVLDRLRSLAQLEHRLMSALTDQLDSLEAKVSETSGVVDSGIVLLDGLTALVLELKNEAADNPALAARVQAVVDALEGKKQALAEAVQRDALPAA